MAVRQYIGARYVPLFYDKNGGNWEPNTIYEPLTIVLYNGNSYTSRKEVPSTVGKPTENPDYWAATGNYNAQIESYRQETVTVDSKLDGINSKLAEHASAISDANSRIDTSNSKIDSFNSEFNGFYTKYANRNQEIALQLPLDGPIVIVGDSYMVGVGSSMNTGLGYTIAYNCGKEVGKDAFIMGQGACGFVKSENLPSFEQIMRREEPQVKDPDSISAVIVVGATNDALRNISNEDFSNALTDLVNYITERYKNAQIFMASNIMSAGYGVTDRTQGYLLSMKTHPHVNFVGDLGTALKKVYLISGDTQSERIHPNQKGYAIAGRLISQWVRGYRSEIECMNLPALDGIDVRVYTRGDTIFLKSLSPSLFNDSNFIFNQPSGGVQHNHLALGHTKNKLKIAGANGSLPFVCGSGYGLLESTFNKERKFYPVMLNYTLGDDGYIYVSSTATIDDIFLWSETFHAFWANMNFESNLTFVQLNI